MSEDDTKKLQSLKPVSQLQVAYTDEASGPGTFGKIEMISFDGGETWYDWNEEIVEITSDASDRGEVVMLKNGDTVYFTTVNDELFLVTVNLVDDELNFNMQERIYPT